MGRRTVIVMLLATLSVLATAGPALAHNSLTGSTPADGARLARPPVAVRLTFLAKLDPARVRVTVTGPDGAAAGGAATVSGNRVTVPFRAGAAGRYEVAYQVPSSDGHPLKGRIRFTLTTGPTPAATATATATPPPTPTPTGAPVLAADREPDGGDGTPWWPWALGVAALLVLGGAGLAVTRRRAR